MSEKPNKAQLNTISIYKAKGIYPGAVRAFEKKYGKPVKKVSKKVSKKKVSSKK